VKHLKACIECLYCSDNNQITKSVFLCQHYHDTFSTVDHQFVLNSCYHLVLLLLPQLTTSSVVMWHCHKHYSIGFNLRHRLNCDYPPYSAVSMYILNCDYIVRSVSILLINEYSLCFTDIVQSLQTDCPSVCRGHHALLLLV